MRTDLQTTRFRPLSIAIAAVLIVGCASWKEPSSSLSVTDPKPNTIRESKKRLILEVEFVNISIDEADPDAEAGLWQWIDETSIDVDVRRRLLANGFRVGMVASDERFRRRLMSTATTPDVVDAFLSQASVASDVAHGEKRIPIRMGRRYELPLHQPLEGSHVAMLRVGDETIGKTLQNAQHFLAITATRAESQKQVHLRFRPEIQYGDSKQKWVSSDTALRIDTRRETWSIPELEIDVTAGEQATFVFSAATPAVGLAKQMLTGASADLQQQQLVVLIRVAQVPSAVDQL